MQDVPLTTNWIFDRGVQYFGSREVVTRTAIDLQRETFGDVAAQTRRLAAALDTLGVPKHGRVGTFAWNTGRHLALYFAIPGTGRVMHTLNIRYFPDQLIYTVDHAQDEVVFVDRSLLPLFGNYLPKLDTVRHVVVMDDGSTADVPDDPRVVGYDDLLNGVDEIDFSDRVRDEQQAAAICYTTGTTGNPKGVLYSHRSMWLHSMAGMTTATFALSDRDRILPVVPMFHANAWGLPYTAVMAGAALIMPGPDLSPSSLISLMAAERVTVAAGVPTIWMGMAGMLGEYDLSALRVVIAGGAAVPKALSQRWREAIGLPLQQAWGMTEMSPLGTVCVLRSEFDGASEEDLAQARTSVGIAPPGVETRIVDSVTRESLPWDGEAFGELEVRGPWVARQYYRSDAPGDSFSADGWLRTGDIASITALGYVHLVDRTKDLVKSGGEWISSVELENELMSHPKVAEAAVIAIAHPKWSERPLACVVVVEGETLTRDEVLAYLRERLRSWQVPDDVVFIDEIPKTSVGKFSKKTLRERFADYQLPTTS